MEIFPAHLLATAIVIAAAAVALPFYLNWKRRQDLAQLAASMGLAFSPDWPDSFSLEGTGLEIFGLGHSSKAANLIQAESGAGIISFFDYRYTIGGENNGSTCKFTLALIACSGCVAPNFDLKPETFIL
jgi:hypothetical protein